MEIREFIKLNEDNISARLRNVLKNYFLQDSNVLKITEKDLSFCVNIGKKSIEEFFKLRDELPQEKTDSIVESVVNQFKERSELGIKKYNTTLDRTDLSTLDWINHAQQESMDFVLYLEKLKKEYENNRNA